MIKLDPTVYLIPVVMCLARDRILRGIQFPVVTGGVPGIPYSVKLFETVSVIVEVPEKNFIRWSEILAVKDLGWDYWISNCYPLTEFKVDWVQTIEGVAVHASYIVCQSWGKEAKRALIILLHLVVQWELWVQSFSNGRFRPNGTQRQTLAVELP